MVETQRRKIATIVRVRPLLREEVLEDPRAKYIAIKMHPGNKRITLTREATADRDFDFDGIAYHKSTTQDSFYQQHCLPSINDLFDGFNTSFIAYGTAAAGKTHTIFGSRPALDSIESPSPHIDSGIIPRSIATLFDRIEKCEDNRQFRVTAIFMELGLENIQDLFAENGKEVSLAPLQVREDTNQGVYVEGLIEKVVKSREELMLAVKRGAKSRFSKSQARTHVILQVFLEQRWTGKSPDGTVRMHHRRALLTFADLAGTEKSGGGSGKVKGKEEAKAVKSLTALYNCVTVLVENRAGKHVPYRESKLTRILADSLGGNSKTTLIACISPSLAKYEETLSTLIFATAASKVRTYPVANEDVKTLRKPGEDSKEKAATPRKPIAKEGPERTTKQSAEPNEESPVISFIAQHRPDPKQISKPEAKSKAKSKTPEISRNGPGDSSSKSVDLLGADSKNHKYSAKKDVVGLGLGISEGPPTAKKQPSQRVDEANKIMRRLAHSIRYLKGEITKKNLVIRRLKEENAVLLKEESKAKSTDMSEGGLEGTAYEAVLNQIMTNPQVKAMLIERLQSEGYAEQKKE